MHAGIACLKAESLGVDSSGSWVEGRGRVVDPRPLGVHVGRVLRLCGLLKGMVVRRTTGRGGALTPAVNKPRGDTDTRERCTRCRDPPAHP